jgi:putative nucleotidyltransferase with HDIG domain
VAEREHTVVVSRKDDIKARVTLIQDLPTLPIIAASLREMIVEPGTSANDIARLVSKDPALSANFLRLVNAPFYGFPGRIACVAHALALAGSNVLKAAVSNIAAWNAPGEQVVGLWEHSLGVALASRLLAQRLNVPGPDEVMTAGLLHDIGKVVLHALYADEAERMYSAAAQRDIWILDAEREALEVDHAEIGLWVAQSWNFPAALKDPIAYHHDPARWEDRAVRPAIVHFADILVRSLDFGHAGDGLIPQLQHGAWDMLGLSLEDLRGVVDEVDNELSVTGTALYRSK